MSSGSVLFQAYYYGQYTGVASAFGASATSFLLDQLSIDYTTGTTHYFVVANTTTASGDTFTPQCIIVELYATGQTPYLNQDNTLPANISNVVVINNITSDIIFIPEVRFAFNGTDDTNSTYFSGTCESFNIGQTVDFIPSSLYADIGTNYQTIYGAENITLSPIVVGNVSDSTGQNGSIFIQSTSAGVTTVSQLFWDQNFSSPAYSNSVSPSYTVYDNSSNTYLFTNGFTSSSTYTYNADGQYLSARFITGVTTPLSTTTINAALTAQYPGYILASGDYAFINDTNAVLYTTDGSSWFLVQTSYTFNGYTPLYNNTTQLFDIGTQKAYNIINASSLTNGLQYGLDGSNNSVQLAIVGSQVQVVDTNVYLYEQSEIDAVSYVSATKTLTCTLATVPVTPSLPIGGILAVRPITFDGTSSPYQSPSQFFLLFLKLTSTTFEPVYVSNTASIRDMRGNNIYQYNGDNSPYTLTSYLSSKKLAESIIDNYLENNFSTSSNGINLFRDDVRFFNVCLDSVGASSYYTFSPAPPSGAELIGTIDTTNPDNYTLGTPQNLIASINTGSGNIWQVSTNAVESPSAPQVAYFKYTFNGITYTLIYNFFVTSSNQPAGYYTFTTGDNSVGNNGFDGTNVVANTDYTLPVPLYGSNTASPTNNVTYTEALSGASTTYFTLNQNDTSVLTLNTGANSDFSGTYKIDVEINYEYSGAIDTSALSANQSPFFYFTYTSGSNIISRVPKFTFVTASDTTTAIQNVGTVSISTVVDLTAGNSLGLFYHPNSLTASVLLGPSTGDTNGDVALCRWSLNRVSS